MSRSSNLFQAPSAEPEPVVGAVVEAAPEPVVEVTPEPVVEVTPEPVVEAEPKIKSSWKTLK
tara:strand:- start:1377 stop:1562 length:186 start_codon:yes stop_codon:yes gene_type:complete